MKKLLSIILAISILLTTSSIGASAILEPTGEYTPSDEVETNRYYFYMPQDWYNEYTDTAGVYWWDGTDACGGIEGTGGDVSWPGYKAKASEEDNIYYLDCPKDVPIILWNNYVDGGEDIEADIFTKAVQSFDLYVEYYCEGDTDLYDNLDDGNFFAIMEESFYGDKSALGDYADNFFIEEDEGFGISFTFDNMIYVVDPEMTKVSSLTGKRIYVGEWYFYYGNGEYGTHPVKADAEARGTVGKLDINNSDNLGEFIPPEGLDTNRYYFYMPQEWCNEYTDTAGLYWWDVRDITGFPDDEFILPWPGYKANKSDEENIFYVDCPKEVECIIWNNYIDGGYDKYAEIYQKAEQSKNVPTEYYSDGDSDTYTTEFFEYIEESFYGDKTALGEYADNFFMEEEYGCGMSFTMDNMIYIIDLTMTDVSELGGKHTCLGEWYFYYGNREYGTYPLKADAEKYGTVGTLELYESNTIEPKPTEPSTPPVTIPEGENVIYFDVKESGWQNVKNVFCHIWRSDGTGLPHSWQSKKEKCVYDESTGIASYDLSKLNFPVTTEDGKEFCVIFSANTGMQTYNTIMSGSCIGDTMYCSGIEIENPEDSEKKAMTAVWKNNPECGPQRRITSKGNIVGTAHAEGDSDVTMLADFLIQYYNDYEKTELTEQLVKELNVSPDDVMEVVRERVEEGDPDGIIPAIEKILSPLVDPTKHLECDLNDDGYTNIIDATLIQKYAVELEPFTSTQIRIADLNSDGVVNVMDSTVLQKYLAGIL